VQGRLTPFGLFLKWVVAPILLAVVGYLIIGPSIGKDIFERLKVPGMETPKDKPKGPAVDVDVKAR
jgi:hypothetical protein